MNLTRACSSPKLLVVSFSSYARVVRSDLLHEGRDLPALYPGSWQISALRKYQASQQSGLASAVQTFLDDPNEQGARRPLSESAAGIYCVIHLSDQFLEICRQIWRQMWAQSPRDQGLEDLLRKPTAFQCLNPRDHICALLGMVGDAHSATSFSIDYQSSILWLVAYILHWCRAPDSYSLCLVLFDRLHVARDDVRRHLWIFIRDFSKGLETWRLNTELYVARSASTGERCLILGSRIPNVWLLSLVLACTSGADTPSGSRYDRFSMLLEKAEETDYVLLSLPLTEILPIAFIHSGLFKRRYHEACASNPNIADHHILKTCTKTSMPRTEQHYASNLESL